MGSKINCQTSGKAASRSTRFHLQRRKLQNYFSGESAGDVNKAIDELICSGYVSEKEGGLVLVVKEFRITGNHVVPFLEDSIDVAHKAVRSHFSDSGKSYFESSIISVRGSTYKKALKKFKAQLLEAQSELESEEADFLVHCNIQLFPST